VITFSGGKILRILITRLSSFLLIPPSQNPVLKHPRSIIFR